MENEKKLITDVTDDILKVNFKLNVRAHTILRSILTLFILNATSSQKPS